MDSKFDRIIAILNVEDVLYSNIERETDELEFYFLTLEKLIDEEERKEVSRLENEATKWVPRWGESGFWSENYPYWWKDVFATQLRFSFVVWAMAVLEHHLNRVCENCAILVDTEWKGKKKREGFIKSAEDFLIKNVGFVQPDKNLWDELDKTYAIRNYLVHHGIIASGPQPNETRKWAQALLDESNGIEIKDYQLKIAPDFCKSIVSNMKELFVQLRAEHKRLCEKIRADAEKDDCSHNSCRFNP